MDFNLVKNKLGSTPAFVLDESKIVSNLTELHNIKKLSGCQVLYSIKALPMASVLSLTQNFLDGLSVSSLFEARLAKESLRTTGHIHITTPGLRDDEFKEVTTLCSHISFNSISQYQRLAGIDSKGCSMGLRINPKLSFADDPRFDPCRPYSKLGVDIETIEVIPDKIEGLHFHTVFSHTNYDSLIHTVLLLKQKFGKSLNQLKWLNLGGGYLYNQINNHQPLIDLIKQLKQQYGLEIFIEPGKAVTGDAGALVATVIDRFSSDGKQIAVLDTSVNHNPEIFEYQRQADLLEADEQGEHTCLFVGSSCLAGDIFGEYKLKKMPEIGRRFVFLNVGAYSLIKANRFNGYNLPDVYAVNSQQKITLLKRWHYQNYRQQWVES